jgi:hypothetical protein
MDGGDNVLKTPSFHLLLYSPPALNPKYFSVMKTSYKYEYQYSCEQNGQMIGRKYREVLWREM